MSAPLVFVDIYRITTVACPGILFGGWGGSRNSVEDRGQTERGSGGGSPLLGGSGGSCNLVQEISFHIVVHDRVSRSERRTNSRYEDG